MWRHAELKLHPNASELDRADCILWLNRAVSLRLKLIHKEYGLRTVARELQIKKGNHAEVLSAIGLIRPQMLQTLTTLRNAVEHEDAPPPPLVRCHEFVEFTWYLLRSTDNLVQERRDYLELIEGAEFISFEFTDKSASLETSGRLNLAMVSWNFRPDWITVQLSKKPFLKSDRSLRFKGTAVGPTPTLLRIWKRNFEIVS